MALLNGVLHGLKHLKQHHFTPHITLDDKLTSLDLVKIALDCSSGMKELASHNIVHNDLAARNLLYFISGTDHRMTIKLGDFGLAFHIEMAHKQQQLALPSQSAPEIALLGWQACSEASDVWSFGMLLDELFTRGKSN